MKQKSIKSSRIMDILRPQQSKTPISDKREILNVNNPEFSDKKFFEKPKELIDYLGDFEGVLTNPDKILNKTGNNIKIYKEIANDNHIRGLINSRKSGIQKLEFFIKNIDRPDAELQYIIEYFDHIDLQKLTDAILNAIYFGYAVIYLEYGNFNGKIVPIKFNIMDNNLFGFDKDNNLVWIENDSIVNDVNYFVIQYENTIINPYGNALLSSAYWLWFFKHTNLYNWNKHNERKASPYIVAKQLETKDNLNYDSKNIGADILENVNNLLNGGSIFLPVGFDVSTLQVGDSRDAFEKLNSNLKNELNVLFLGSDSAANSTPGKLGGDVNTENTISRIIDADKSFVSYYINLFLKKYLYPTAFGITDNIKYCSYELMEENGIDLKALTRDKGLTEMGVVFNAEYIKDTYGIDEKYFVMNDNIEVTNNTKSNTMLFNNEVMDSTAVDIAEQSEKNSNTVIELENYAGDPAITNKIMQPMIDTIINEITNNASNGKEAFDVVSKMYNKLKSEELRLHTESVILAADIFGNDTEQTESK